MSSTYSEIELPFVYLDSSSLLRSSWNTFRSFTRKNAIKHPQKFLHTLEELKILSQKDTQYYQQIIQLQQNTMISSLITFEAIHNSIRNNAMDQIALFGILDNLKVDLSTEQILWPENLVLWGETVDVKTYNQAAITIANANCVVIDPNFIKLSVGKSLTNYISSTCRVVALGLESVELPLDIKFSHCKLLPEEFVANLLRTVH